MNKIKELYSSPTTKILVVRFEETILQGSPTYNPNGTEQGNSRDGEEEGFIFG